MGWDSNPRYACTHGGFQDRCLKPLGHPSTPLFSYSMASVLSRCLAVARGLRPGWGRSPRPLPRVNRRPKGLFLSDLEQLALLPGPEPLAEGRLRRGQLSSDPILEPPTLVCGPRRNVRLRFRVRQAHSTAWCSRSAGGGRGSSGHRPRRQAAPRWRRLSWRSCSTRASGGRWSRSNGRNARQRLIEAHLDAGEANDKVWLYAANADGAYAAAALRDVIQWLIPLADRMERRGADPAAPF